MSSCSTSRFMLAAMLSTVRMEVIFTTGANISSKSTPFFCWNPFTTILALYLGGFPPSRGALYLGGFCCVIFTF